MRYYYKLISKQDVSRSFVFNKKAIEHHFRLNLLRHGDESSIQLKYNSFEHVETKIVLHQDARILIQNRLFKVGQVAFFSRQKDNYFNLAVYSQFDQIQKIVRHLNRDNYYLSNTKIATDAT